MSKFRKILGLALILVFAVVVAGCGAKTVAEVNGEKITQEQLDKRVNKMKLAYEQQGASFEGEQGKQMLEAIKKQTLDQMIDQLLIKQAAEKEGVAPSDAEVQKRFDEIKKRFKSEKEFEDALKNYNYTEEELKEYIAQQAMTDALFQKVTKDVKVTEEDMKKYYEERKDSFKEPEKIKARHILIKFDTANEKVGRKEEEAKKMAEELIAKLNNGADFAELAKEKSEDPGSKNDGGLLKDPMGSDYFARGVMVKEFDDAAFALKKGEITKKPVKTQFGYHIIKVEDKKPEKQKTYEEAKEQIKKDLPNTRKQEVFNKYIEGLKQKAKITNELTKNEPAASKLPQGHPPINENK
ncbi:PpiC-type peptidyl-prolyl cis-trans isomerase [Thermincola ferriacetica]|uniref:peptidylprolyl isomerase n=1 Tax=Thermincola ferriacetica TaxID=281456 RepID=A0A0L6W0A5_9FIRM|nr:peptidylprolyl isomerase [Thermincola ferriacetica]KNZ68901.1 PpiC-type peptidyl-prolyl cis-trans isomerase [Thermincola ferriacetica]